MLWPRNIDQAAVDYVLATKIQDFDEYRTDFDIRTVLTKNGMILVENDVIVDVIHAVTVDVPQNFQRFVNLALTTHTEKPMGKDDIFAYDCGPEDIVVTVAGLHKRAVFTAQGEVCGLVPHVEQYFVKKSDGLAHYVSPPLDCDLQTTYDYITL